MARVSTCLAAALLSIVATHATAQTTDFKPVTEEMLANPDPADWLMISRTFDQHRYSPLNQINKDNVGQLRMAWTRGLPAGTQESTPIVYRGVMYMNVPGGNVQAINATNGDLIWEYARDYPKHINPRASRHKNLGIFEDMIYFAAPDGVIVALDIATGKVRWETKTDTGGITAGGILVADGKVLTNRMCMHMTRDMCFISAHDARTGKEVWKFYTTAAAGEPGGDSWADMPTEKRAASPWGLPGSYDPKRRVTYWGIANPDPYTRLSPARQPRCDPVLGAVEPLQQFHGRARHRDRQARLALPGTAGRRLGCRSQPGAHPAAHDRQSGRPPREMALVRSAAQSGARGGGDGRRGRRTVHGRAGRRKVPVGAPVPL